MWGSTFYYPGIPRAVYAIAALRENYSGWSSRRDLDAFSHFGFERMNSIEQVLETLSNFGWFPTGYSYYGKTSQRFHNK